MKNRSVKRIVLMLIVVWQVFSSPSSAFAAIQEVPWEDYRPSLEPEIFRPTLYYDGSLYTGIYGQMSDVLREHELSFMLYANEETEEFRYALGYTRHYGKWSCGLNLYSAPIYLGEIWDPCFFEYQQGISVLGSYHWNNETRLDLRLQWEDFEAEALSSKLEDLVENGKVFGCEVTLNHDDFVFLSQSGTREYLSLGGAYPLFGTDFQYFKMEGDRRSYHPLGERVSLIWGARGGKIWGSHPEHRSFLIGGIQTNTSALGSIDNFGIFGGLADSVLRGYSDASFVGDGFVTGNLEFRTLIWPATYQRITGFAMLGSLFIDGGQVWKEDTPLTPEPVGSWGAGLKFLILRGLMLGFDYAIPFDAEEKEKWHFSLGEIF